MNKFKEIIELVLAILLVIAAGWGVAANQLLLSKIFNPQFEQVRRETFEQSKAYRDGVVQELYALRVSYLQAEPMTRSAWIGVIRHKAAGLPDDALPTDLKLFLKELP